MKRPSVASIRSARASTSSSTAAAAGDSPDKAATRRTLVASPSTAVARATASAPAESRRIRAVTVRATVPGHGRADVVGLRRAALERRGAQQLGHQQRVAAGGLEAGGDELGRRVDAGADQLAHPAGRQRGGAQQARRGRGGEAVEQLLLGTRLGGARSDRQQHRQVLDPAGERVEEAQARRVGPVRVVDDHQQRLLGGEVRAQPVEPVERRVGRVVAFGHGGAEHRLGQRGRARQQRRAALGVGSVQLPLEQLADDPEREVALQRGARRAQHPQTRVRGLRAQHAQQRGLALTGRGLQQRDRPVRRARRRQRARQVLQFGPALEQGVRTGRRHSMLDCDQPVPRA